VRTHQRRSTAFETSRLAGLRLAANRHNDPCAHGQAQQAPAYYGLERRSMIYGVDYETRTLSGVKQATAERRDQVRCGSCGQPVQSVSRCVWDERLLVGPCCENLHRKPVFGVRLGQSAAQRHGRAVPGLRLRHKRKRPVSQDRAFRTDSAVRNAPVGTNPNPTGEIGRVRGSQGPERRRAGSRSGRLIAQTAPRFCVFFTGIAPRKSAKLMRRHQINI
jgi:hypothetical protein